MAQISIRQYWKRDGKWSNSLYLNFNDDKFNLNANEANYANDNYGTPFALPGVSL